MGRYEVIPDQVVVTPTPSPRHQAALADLLLLLYGFVEDHGLGEMLIGPIDVLLAEGDYLEPDLVFVRKGRENLITDRGIEGPPDLVVEVVSPSTESRDRGVKLERYRHYGVGEYWIVDPDARSVEVWRLAAGAGEALVLGTEDVLRWTPVEGGETLEVPVEEIVPRPS